MRWFTKGEGTPAFRISWRGYNRADVDEFLRQTAADRQRLHEDLAQLEAVMAPSARPARSSHTGLRRPITRTFWKTEISGFEDLRIWGFGPSSTVNPQILRS